MKLTGIDPDPSTRQELDLLLRSHIKLYLRNDLVSAEEVVFLLTRSLAELANASVVTGHLIAAYALAEQRGQEPALNPKTLCPSP